ncbi:MAG: hypothetical protein KKD92_10955 [Proteobacteria bacterium]|nr:hypothetical protein [Pseudomonadota bacterium]
MITKKPITDLIRKRYSCRTYSTRPVAKDLKDQLEQLLAGSPVKCIILIPIIITKEKGNILWTTDVLF